MNGFERHGRHRLIAPETVGEEVEAMDAILAASWRALSTIAFVLPARTLG
ncbi:hypothetical protein [Microvirga vignae]